MERRRSRGRLRPVLPTQPSWGRQRHPPRTGEARAVTAAGEVGTAAGDTFPPRLASGVGPDVVAGSGNAPRTPARQGFRADLEGLRGVAILCVLLFHAGLPGMPGGFVGVDVFFVLSGFLITGLLIREHEAHGRVALTAFYARRARRLLPAAAVSLVVILLLAARFSAPLDFPGVAEDVAAAAASVGNIRFTLAANDYFAADVTRSPVLHFWSLGVEEQFYVVWPAMLVLAMRFRRRRAGVVLVLFTVFAASLSTAVWLTTASPAWAFYSLPSRAWQLALGGLVAAILPLLSRVPWPAAAAISWGGLASVLLAVVVIDPVDPYPGVAALMPSLGAAALIVGGDRRGSPRVLLSTAPIRFLGRISYSLYLVHWPILVLPAATLALGEQLPLPVRLGLSATSVVVGWVSYRFVEAPFHHGRRVASARPSRVLGLAGASIALAIILAVAVGADATRRLDEPVPVAQEGTGHGIAAGSLAPPASGDLTGVGTPQPADGPPVLTANRGEEAGVDEGTPQPGDLPQPDETVADSDPGNGIDSSPAGTGPPAGTGALATARPTPSPAGTPTIRVPLPTGLLPPLSRARNDVERLDRDGCTLGTLDVRPKDCTYGSRDSDVVVALVGDSHTAQWFPALEVIAEERRWRLVPYTKVSCRFLDMAFRSRTLQREYRECAQWRELVMDRLTQLQPDLVITSVARAPSPLTAQDDSPRRQGEALARLLLRLPGKKAIIVDTPQFDIDPPQCLSLHRDDIRRCSMPWATAFNWRRLILERTAASSTGATIIDLSDRICPAHWCDEVQGHTIVFRDYHHLTATFAASLATDLMHLLPDPAQARAGAGRGPDGQ